ncbi:MAG: hypothetical protein KAG97_10570, partial [Victivallales bacterium]|nr:hypothetical protein [Victivallales bacterium]
MSTGNRRKILVANPPLLIGSDFIDYPYFANLGALQCAATLEARGHAVHVADAFSLAESDAFLMDDHRFLIGCAPETLVDSIKDESYDAILVCLGVFHKPFVRHAPTKRCLDLLKTRFPSSEIAVAG